MKILVKREKYREGNNSFQKHQNNMIFLNIFKKKNLKTSMLALLAFLVVDNKSCCGSDDFRSHFYYSSKCRIRCFKHLHV